MTAYTTPVTVVTGQFTLLGPSPMKVQWQGGYPLVNLVVSDDLPEINAVGITVNWGEPEESIYVESNVWAIVPDNGRQDSALVGVMQLPAGSSDAGGGSDAATATMQQRELNAISALNSFLADSMPMLYDSSYSVKTTAFTYANLYQRLNVDGSVDPNYMYSQRFDLSGNEAWYTERIDGTSVVLGTLKTANDSDVRLVSENIVQSISELRTLIGRTPAVTSARTRTYAMWPPHWEIGESGWM